MSNQLAELKASLDRVDTTLALLIKVADEQTPKLKKDIQQITETVQEGFNTVRLRSQAKAALEAGLNESHIAAINKQAENTAQILTNAVKTAEQSATHYEKNANSYSFWLTLLMSSCIAFTVGFIVVWIRTYNRIDRYQDEIKKAEHYINQSCKQKQDFARFVNSTIDCSKSSWDLMGDR